MPIFRQVRLCERLNERDRGARDGIEKGWVHDAQLAWQRHYVHRRLTKLLGSKKAAGRPKDRQFLRRYPSLLTEQP
ncbi:MAG: hypothetical protein HYS71_02820 [Candidatus Omnitrophica bacterium]|nr:hypothetical protein [Candidatus Omnitrophota bacterium]